MALVTTNNEYYKNIADKIREKIGTNDTYTPGEMPGGIEKAYTGLIDGSAKVVVSDAEEVRDYAFQQRTALEKVVLPKLVSLSGAQAFSGCTNLVEFIAPSLKHITGASCFSGDAKLEKLHMPLLETITQSGCFSGCNLKEIDFPKLVRVGNMAFRDNTSLVSANLPVLVESGNYLFNTCTSLETVNLPALERFTSRTAGQAFNKCTSLKTLTLPKLLEVPSYCMQLAGVEFVDLPSATYIGDGAFNVCSNLNALLLRNTNAVATLQNVRAFDSTPIKSGAGFVYVPASLVNSYKTATNWTTYAAQIRALEDYTVDGTITGKLDMTKI